MKKTLKILKERTLELLKAQPHQFFKAKDLARKLGVPPAHYSAYRNLLREMAEEGLIQKYKSNRYGAIQPKSTVIGKLHVKSQGYGFILTPEGEEDVFVSQKNMGTALDGDIVKVQLFAAPRGKSPEGKVIEVVQRTRKYIVGTLVKGKYFYYVMPDDLKILHDIYIYEDGLNGAKPGQKVAVVIDNWEDEFLNPEGHVVQVLGYPDEPGVDVSSVAASFNLPLKFPDEVEQEAQAIPERIPNDELQRRLDLRNVVCFTIDPEDAKDFDDAVSIRRLDTGHYELGVHIADVSYYVKEGGKIDREAFERGTSVYLVDRVVPMLPERLSNQLCSLREGEDRLTFSCIMEVTPAGEMIRYRIVESVIRSTKRFSYEEVQAFLDGELELPPKLAEPLSQMAALARALRRRRLQQGSLDFDTPEPKVILDVHGQPVDIKRKETLESMRIIEEFMLLANKTVAEHIESLPGEEPPPFIYRVHERPAKEKMQAFADFVKALGYEFRLDGRITSKKLANLIRHIKGTDEEVIIENVMLRSLMKAKYDVVNIGHFGLAFKHYTHFTSPIRRYPDLVVHRMLKFYGSKQWHEDLRDALLKKLDKICKQASEREVVALEAERASTKLKQAEFMAQHIGEEYDGIISGVVHFGIFVEIPQYLVEGLVHITDLDDDYYIFDEQMFTLIGQSKGQTYRIGDPVRIKVVKVDTDEGLIDFVLAKKLERKKKQKAKKKSSSASKQKSSQSSQKQRGQQRKKKPKKKKAS